MSQASNVIAMPMAREKRYVPPLHRATVIDIDDFFAAPPATNLQEAKERIFRELPPKPDLSGLRDFEQVEAIYNWVRARLYVYETVMFG